MVSFLITVVKLLVIIVAVATIHEFGHFLASKLLKVGVDEFSIGFGPKIVQKKFKGTMYSLRWLPLGGYCAIEGEEETEENKNSESSYQRKTSTTKYGTDPQNVNDKVSISYGDGTSTHNSMSAGVVNPPVGGSVSDMQGESVKPNDPIDTDGKDVNEENDGVISVGGGATEEEQNDANGTSRQY